MAFRPAGPEPGHVQQINRDDLQVDRAEVVHEAFLKRVASGDLPRSISHVSLEDASIDGAGFAALMRSQFTSRQLDRTSRKMQARGEGFYTIGSSGHEGNAAIAAAFRVEDMAFLHYRDAAFFLHRASMLPGETPVWDMLLSFAASSDDPISGGRHKVLGSKRLFIPPQTSTIASHLPKAVGAAFSVGLAAQLKPEHQQLADDAIILCSFGDASVNHSTAQGAINAAAWSGYQGAPMPLVFICEDNGIGISTKTPQGWIAANYKNRPGLKYIACNGLDVLDTLKAAREAEEYVRQTRKPVFLHMKCVRLYGHAGVDIQTAYMSRQEVEAAEHNDPLLHTARLAIEHSVMTAGQVIEMYEGIGGQCEAVAREASKRPKLETAGGVMASIVPPARKCKATNGPSAESRKAVLADELASMEKPQHMAKLINWALHDLMIEHGEIVVAGEDVGPKGGVYNVTAKLHERFGGKRVINTLLDEQSILGLGIGLAHNGILPMPEIQFLAYLHNAEDQLRGEAATLSFFSNGQYTNPMVVRIAGLGYQRGFGGHFHNDNSLAVLRDIPGIVIACPSDGRDAVLMLRECVRLAREEQRVVVIVEPIALYMMRDLHKEKDGGWTRNYPAPGEGEPISVGQVGQHGNGKDLAIVTYGNGHYLSRKAQKVLRESHGLDARVIDLRWLAPLDPSSILDAVGPCERVLVVDECRVTGSQSEALMALFAEHSPDSHVARLAAQDSFIPLGKGATVTLPSVDSIVEHALKTANENLRGERDG